MRNAVIVACGRAPVGRARKGGFVGTHPVEYAAQVLRKVLDRVPELSREEIDDLVVGCAKPEGVQGSNMARVIGLRAGLPFSVPGQTINRFCSSGLQAIATSANAIMVGEADVIVAGGVEDMTDIPMAAPDEVKDPWMLAHSDVYMPMGMTAENVAQRYGLTREELDAFAVKSHQKAAAAQEAGYFKDQIIPVEVVSTDGEKRVLTQDEGIRKNCSAESLAELKPVFKEDGVVTAATSSPLSDGAAFVVMMSEEKANALKIKPIARFLSFAVAGVDPSVMGLGPIKAVPKALKKAGLTVEDLSVIELNEAFAAQSIPCIRELGFDTDKVNPNGGAIAMGHPLGATGAILTCKLLSELQRVDGRFGLVTMCIGGGMGAAGVFEYLKLQ